jgi:hypothetical protein
MMGDRALYLQRVLKFMAAEGILELELGERDWCILQLCTDLLRPMAEVQRLLEGEKYVTLSMVPISVDKIRTGLHAAASGLGGEGGGGGGGESAIMKAARRDMIPVAQTLLDDFNGR